ncbi:guanylate kinase [Bacteroidota bacterium]
MSMNANKILNSDTRIIIFSAPSGSGKTTIANRILKKPLNLEFSVSACSRSKRIGEIHEKDYYFLSVQEFKEKISNGEFLEWEEVYADNFYGTLWSEIERIQNKGKHIIFDVDVIGGLNLKKEFGDKALSIFIMPPSIKVLEERLKIRSTESIEDIQKRISKAEKEISYNKKFDELIINDNLEKSVIEAEKLIIEFLRDE